MTYNLPTEFAKFVESAVAAGDFSSPEDVVAAGLRLLQERREYDEYVRRAVQEGLDQLDRGEGRTFHNEEELRNFFEEIKARGRANLEAEQRAAS